VRRVTGLVFVFCAASLVSESAVAKLPPPVPKPAAAKLTAAQRAAAKAAAEAAAVALLAPADEYFGPLKQSVVGIRNEIRVLGWNYDVNHDIGPQTVATAQLTERAIREWAKKYPRDDQVPKTLFLMQRLYTKVLTQDSRNHAHVIAQWLMLSYAKSPQAKQLKKVLGTEHLAALPLPSASPAAASAYQSVFGSQYTSVFGNASNVAPAASATAPAAPATAPPAPATSAHP
jgi:hypothetical protein